jgi:hypothetical protein
LNVFTVILVVGLAAVSLVVIVGGGHLKPLEKADREPGVSGAKFVLETERKILLLFILPRDYGLSLALKFLLPHDKVAVQHFMSSLQFAHISVFFLLVFALLLLAFIMCHVLFGDYLHVVFGFLSVL